MEAASVTGPAKNLLGFCRWSRSQEALELGVPFAIELATYVRPGSGPEQNKFVEAARADGVPMHLIHESGRFDRSVLPRLREIAGQISPDLIQTHNVKSHFLCKASGLNRKYPWLAFQHGYTDTDFKMALYNQLDRWSLRSARRVVTVCQAFAKNLPPLGVRPENVRVLHNSISAPPAVPAADVAALRQKFGIEPDEAVILTIGRFSAEKGHADLVEALAHLARTHPAARWKALWVGTGPAQPLLEQLAAKHGVSGRIVFAGFQSPVTPFFAAAGIVAVPSHSEGSPNVVLEAMAARVPIAATAAGGTPEIIAHESTGLLSPIKDPAAFSVSLSRLLSDPALGIRLAIAAAERARLHFSPEAYRRSLIEIYGELLCSARIS